MHQISGEMAAEADALATTYASFVQYAWNGETQRFRNFMGFDRLWCEEVGSEDSCGRALWAIGVTAAQARQLDLRIWASSLYRSEEHTSELQSLMRISYAVFCLKKKKPNSSNLHRII